MNALTGPNRKSRRSNRRNELMVCQRPGLSLSAIDRRAWSDGLGEGLPIHVRIARLRNSICAVDINATHPAFPARFAGFVMDDGGAKLSKQKARAETRAEQTD